LLLDIQAPEAYRRLHVPGAVNAPYAQWRTGDRSALPGMLPPTEQLERFLGALGITPDSALVIIAAGSQAGDMAAASRVFWTLKVMGQAKVAVLNGGLLDYARRYPRELETTPHLAKPTRYRAVLDNRIRADAAQVQAALGQGGQLLDARTLGEYAGVLTAKPGERPGTIPGAGHLPFDWLLDARGLIREQSAAATLFKYAALDPNKDGTIHFCHTGNRAALTWFVDYAILGNRNAKLYDASMSEWSTRPALPMEAKIRLPERSGPKSR
jgi:thiosulfate/3-mercaptopyruvate sulfurtransferase